MSAPPKANREQWASKIGVILAVSGSAVGLGNFLRFPGRAAAYGGGAFLIPYFISFLVLGIPICWVEWTLGREGGRAGFNSSPGILHHLLRNRLATMVFGTLGLLIPVAIYMYYVYIEAWCFGYAVYYLLGRMPSSSDASRFSEHFNWFVGAGRNGLLQPALPYLAIVFVLNFYLIYRGLSKGIESFCKVAMPLLIVAALVVLGRVLTLPPQPVAEPWPFALAQALPADEWESLKADLLALHESELEEEKKTEAIRKRLREAVDARRAGARHDDASDERARVPVEVPDGFLATPSGLAITFALLDSPTAMEAYARWIPQTRAALGVETKWELIRLEAAQASAEAPQEIAEYEQMRAELVGEAPTPPPTIPSVGRIGTLRFAAAVVANVPRTVRNGLGFMWNPKPTRPGHGAFAALRDPQVWLEAAGQIFFSISVGFGIIITYASYLRRDDDVVLSGLTATSTNEFCEVCLGGLITVPAAFIFLGATPLAGVPSTLGLGFATLPAVFEAMPAGHFFGFLWFAMLFAAAVTSSLSMLQPAIAFLEEGFDLRRKASVTILGLIASVGCLIVVYFSQDLRALDTIDFWIGSFCVFIMATVLVIAFGWLVGVDRGLALAHEGAELRIPRVFRFIIKYVSPAYLLTIFGFWLYYEARTRVGVIAEHDENLLSVFFVIVVGAFFAVLVSLAIRRWNSAGPPAMQAASGPEESI